MMTRTAVTSLVTITLVLLNVGVRANPAYLGLITAVRGQDYETVEALLKTQVDLNAAQPDGATALHWAAYLNELRLAELLVNSGALVNMSNDYGVTPLALACDNAANSMVALLLDAGADPHIARNTGETPLMTCARTGAVDGVRALLANGADLTATDPLSGQTALLWAIGERHTEIVRTLAEHSDDVNTVTTRGNTPLMIAARANEPELAQILLDAGANVNASTPNGFTALMIATIRGNAAVAIQLLDHGADPNIDAAGYTPLHWAAGSWHTELTGPNGIDTARHEEWRSLNGIRDGRLALVNALLDHDADPNARLAKSPPQYGYASPRFRVSITGATPFLLAAMDANVEVMQALADAGADPFAATDRHTTPLMVAAGLGRVPAESRVTEEQSIESVHYLLELSDNINSTNDVGRTALHGAAHIRSDMLVQLLFDHGATVNAKDERGITPLMIAEGGGHIFLPGLGGGSTADLLRKLGSEKTRRSDLIENFNRGQTRRRQ